MNENSHETTFQPKGAIAFFVVMVVFYAALWLLFYFILLGRK